MVDPISPQQQKNHEDRARVLTAFMLPSLKGSDLESASLRLAAEMGLKELKALQNRFFRLSPADRLRLEHLRDDGAHKSVLLQYIAATQDYEIEGRPTRDKLFSEFQKRQAQERSQKPFEVAVRVAVPSILIATGTLIIPLAAAKITLAMGLADSTNATLALATQVQAVLDPILKQGTELVAEETGGWLARAALAVGAWMGWSYASHLTPDLKSTMFEAETELLDPLTGPARHSIALHAALRAIPLPDRHLLGHLMPVELRTFLRGDDDIRRDILRRQPPPLLAQAKAILATNPPGFANFFRAVRDLGDVCLPSAWRKGVLNNPRLDTSAKLASWRHARQERPVAAPELLPTSAPRSVSRRTPKPQ